MRIVPSFRKRLALNVYRRYIDTQVKLHDLSYLFWECTLRCNINCLHCGSDCHRDYQQKDMPAKDFLEVCRCISQHYDPNHVMVIISGGEPLMRKDLEAVGIELNKMGFPWGMVTNGYAMTTQRFQNLLQAGLGSITLSLDGFEEAHNWLRGRNDSFQRALNTLRMMTQVPDLVCDAVTCVTQRNIASLQEFKEFLIQQGLKRWRLFSIIPIGRAADNPDFQLSDEDLYNLVVFIRQTRREGRIRVDYGCEGFFGDLEGEVRNSFYFCRAGITVASVLADGSISACPNIDRAFIQGNIYTDDFLDVWNKGFDAMRNREWLKTGVCEDCEAFKWCRGNGFHLHKPDNPNVLRCQYQALKRANY